MFTVLTEAANVIEAIVAANVAAVNVGVLPEIPGSATDANAPWPVAPWRSQSHVCDAPYVKDGLLLVR